jgi:hypothetical protein
MSGAGGVKSIAAPRIVGGMADYPQDVAIDQGSGLAQACGMDQAMTLPFTGRCRCGAVAYQGTAQPLWQAHCHCDSCRRATGGLFASYFGMARGDWRWTGALPAVFRPGGGVERFFCATCGSPIAFASPEWPDEMHFFAGTLDQVAAYAPDRHSFVEEALPWLPLISILR